METTTAIIKDEIVIDGQILFDRPNSIIVGRIVEVREKAVKIDYAVDPVHPSHSGMMLAVYNYCCWLPKSVIVNEKNGGLTVKAWFARNFSGGFRIKKYFMKEGEKIFI